MAESDCNLALALNKNYTKAYSRRGAARFVLRNVKGAKEGTCHVLYNAFLFLLYYVKPLIYRVYI